METKPETYYNELISRYLDGEATPVDIEELSRWVDFDPANREVFVSLHRAWLKIREDQIADLDLNREFQNVAPASFAHIPWFSTLTFLRIAAVVLLFLVPSFFVFKYFTATRTQYVSSSGTALEQQLPDGTIVTLNAASSLEYPKKFRSHSRVVTLNGDAWFEVSRDEKRPFVISSGKVRIEVLGTSFYVNTRSAEDQMEIILSSGTVALFYDDRPDQRVILNPGETASVGISSEEISVVQTDDPNFLSWKTKKIVFENESLDMVVNTLNKVYLTRIILTEPGLERCRLTATFDHQPVESVLAVLEAVLDVKVEKTTRSILISGPACE